jgi:hypothetical protein
MDGRVLGGSLILLQPPPVPGLRKFAKELMGFYEGTRMEPKQMVNSG